MSYRARTIDAAASGAPPEDVLRLAHPAHYLPVLTCTHDAYSPQAANDGMEFVKMLSALSKNPWRPAPHWRCAVRRDGQGPKALPERATGTLAEVAEVMGKVKADCRRAVFGRGVRTFRFQGWYLGVAKNLREILAPLLSSEPNAVERRLRQPFEGVWPFPLSCKECKVTKPPAKGPKPSQGWRPNPGCPVCRRHVVFVIRGVTLLACRLSTLGNPSRNWMLRATHSSDEGRFPFEKRRSRPAAARRLVRGSPDAQGPVDFWPGKKAEQRPEASRPDGEPQA